MEGKNLENDSKYIETRDMEPVKENTSTAFNTANVLKEIFRRKNFILKILAIFLIVGLIVALITPKEYTASTLILPQVSQEKGLGKKFGNFAAMVGLKLGESGGTEIMPTLYPVIIQSAPFQREILNTPLQLEGYDETVTLSKYLTDIKEPNPLSTVKKYTIGLPGFILSKIRGKNIESQIKVADSGIYKITALEKDQIQFLTDNLSVKFNEIEGYIQITATMEQPVAAAQLTKNAQEVLQKFIIEYNIQKAKDELSYIEDRYSEAKKDYTEKKSKLGNFKDRNQNYIFSITENRLDELTSDYDLSYNLFSQLATEAESARLKVKKDTPIFTILKPVTVPQEASAPSTSLIIFSYLFVGFLLAAFFVLFQKYYPTVKAYLKN